MPVKFLKNFVHVDDVEEVAKHDELSLDQRIKARKIEMVPIDRLHRNPKNAKKHPKRQIALLAENFEQFGFTQPVIADENYQLVSGHARHEAALSIGLSHLPVIRLEGLTPHHLKALAIADNKLAELGKWDLEALSEELASLYEPPADLTFDPRIIGFETVEIDQIMGDGSVKPDHKDSADQFDPPIADAIAVTQPGDIWVCGEHHLLCGDATDPADYVKLLDEDRAGMVFTDPPYNCPNLGFVTKRAGVREFAMAGGELSSAEYQAFLFVVHRNIFERLVEGAVVYTCTGWRHYPELRAATASLFGEPKNTIVWDKTTAGLGTFYRSQHELILVNAAPGKTINNFGLGGKGRHRTNVWKYPGFNGFTLGREEAFAMHPTVKPVAMVMDAMKDCSNRGSIVLDPFAGSGTCMIAAERTKRRARLMEIDPLYCDTIVRRWQKFTGKIATLKDTVITFDEVVAERANRS